MLTSNVSSKACRAPGGSESTRATSPTWITSSLELPSKLKTPPNSTRNISGKTSAKKTAARSRAKPFRIATATAQNGLGARSRRGSRAVLLGVRVEVVMRGTPVR